MHIQSARNNQNTSFRGFAQPTKEVLAHFEHTMSKIKPEARETFVKEMSDIVKKQEGNPITISQRMTIGNSNGCYELEIGGTKLTVGHHSTIENYSTAVINAMKKAGNIADDLLDLSKNMKKIKNIFNLN